MREREGKIADFFSVWVYMYMNIWIKFLYNYSPFSAYAITADSRCCKKYTKINNNTEMITHWAGRFSWTYVDVLLSIFYSLFIYLFLAGKCVLRMGEEQNEHYIILILRLIRFIFGIFLLFFTFVFFQNSFFMQLYIHI